MRVSVLFIKTIEGTTCIIEKDDTKWLDTLKSSIAEYLKNRFIPDKDSVLSFCETAKCLKKLQVLVNTFINPTFLFSWIISSSVLPDFSNVDIVEFLLEPIKDETIPEPEPVTIDSLEPEALPTESVLAPAPYNPELVRDDTPFVESHTLRKIRMLEAELKIKELQAELDQFKQSI